jgi:hypothetical protein
VNRRIEGGSGKHAYLFIALAALSLLATGTGKAGERTAIAPPQMEALSASALESPQNGRLPITTDARYPYDSALFDELVRESYRVGNKAAASQFYVWLESAYEARGPRLPGREYLRLEELLAATHRDLSAMPPGALKDETEAAICVWLHRLIQRLLPRYDLVRGFEFHNAAGYGMRQCFLQSVLMASLLQAMGLDAGVVMVYRNPAGYETNNSHATVLIKLSGGQDLLLDASYPDPFIRHRGLFVRCPEYRYVDAVYEPGSPRISSYRDAERRGWIETAQVRPLDLSFIQSQFSYYRGERAEGGALAQKKTPGGLEASRRHLETSLRLCPRNPLPAYFLTQVYRAQGETERAREMRALAYRLYSQSGWVPASLRSASPSSRRSSDRRELLEPHHIVRARNDQPEQAVTGGCGCRPCPGGPRPASPWR